MPKVTILEIHWKGTTTNIDEAERRLIDEIETRHPSTIHEVLHVETVDRIPQLFEVKT